MEDFDNKIDAIIEDSVINSISDLDRTPFRLIKSLLLRVKDVSSSPEARDIINQAINISYYGLKDKNQLLVFGDSVKNEEEDLSDFDYMNRVMLNYSEFDIKKLFGLSLDEFANKTIYDQNLLIKNALKLMEIKSKREEEMLKEIETENKNTRNTLDGLEGEDDD